MPSFMLFSIILLIYNVEAGIYDLFKPEMRLVGFEIEKISPIGIQMCVKKCSKRVSCASVNFIRAQMECELSCSDATSNPANVTSDTGYIYLERNQIPQVLT